MYEIYTFGIAAMNFPRAELYVNQCNAIFPFLYVKSFCFIKNLAEFFKGKQ